MTIANIRKLTTTAVALALAAVGLASCAGEDGPDPSPGTSAEPVLSGTLPVLYVDTDGSKPVTSRTEYIGAACSLDPMDTDGVEPLGSRTDPVRLQIRGRGHSSWKGAKKPYKLKFDRKTAVMGMPANKHWALIKPLEYTVAGMELARLCGMGWSPRLRPVELVLNGDYAGLYLLIETVRIGKNRVDIYEQEDGETDPELIGGGWLVEVDNYADDCQITLPENDRWTLTVKYHSPENLSPPQLQWLKDEFRAVNAAVYNPDKSSTEWESHIDVEAMARYFILQELVDNPDGFHGSFYLHRDLGSDARWKAGPAWDLMCYNREKTDYTFRMKVHYGFIPHWIGEIMRYDSFCRAVRRVWSEIYPARLDAIYDYIDREVLPMGEAWQADAARWGDDPSQTARVRAERIKTALRRNIEWFDSHLPEAE